MGTKIFTPSNKLILLVYFNSNGGPRPTKMITTFTQHYDGRINDKPRTARWSSGDGER